MARAVVPALLVMIAVVGIIDAATARTWDLVALFAALVVLGAIAAAPVRRRRKALSIRADLFDFLHERASAGDENVGRVADRAVAAYRAALTDTTGPPKLPQ